MLLFCSLRSSIAFHSFSLSNLSSPNVAGNLNAANQNYDGSYDIGLWQINDQNWGQWYVVAARQDEISDSPQLMIESLLTISVLHNSSGGNAPCDFNSNLNCAIKVWSWGGNSFRLWSTCSACGCC
jgi:hypothetical protein